MPNPVSEVLNKGAEFLFGEVGMSHRFTFSVDKGSYDLGSWSKVTGLSVNWAMCTYTYGGTDNSFWVSPGPPKYPNIKLSRAACSDSATVQKWLGEALNDRVPLSGSVMMLDWLGTTIVEWKMDHFFPCGWSITEFDAGSAKPLVETLEIAHTGFIG
ncbi:MAG TPA: phage tail protein [Pseudonocardiaceae bacterium]|nr:phage tail protein [Pseudonocardiaceae bacterium]